MYVRMYVRMCVCVHTSVCYTNSCVCILMCGGYCTRPASTSSLCQTAHLPCNSSELSSALYLSKGGDGTAVVTLRHPTLIGSEGSKQTYIVNHMCMNTVEVPDT